MVRRCTLVVVEVLWLALPSVVAAYVLPVTNGLSLWLDAADSGTVILDGGNLIQQWNDKSGNAYHAAQGDSTRRPSLFATAVNGLPAVRFDGSNDGLVIADGLALGRPYTVFVVDQYYGGTQGRTLQSRDVNWLMGKWGGKNAHYANGFVNDPNANVAGTGNPVIGEALGTPTTSLYFISGVNKTTTVAPTGSPGKLGLVNGGGSYSGEVSHADVSEVIVYNRVLLHSERELVRSYLAEKWSLANVGPNNLGTAAAFSGADSGEGLDLQGTYIPYAINVRGPQTAVGGLTFTQDGGPGTTGSTPGFSVESNSGSGYFTWDNKPDYGATAADDGLETVMHSIRYSNAAGTPPYVKADMNVVPGRQYKMQLLFSENILNRPAGSRTFDVEVEGQLAYDELDLNDVMGQYLSNPITKGVVYTQTLLAADHQLNVRLLPSTSGNDHGPILQGVVLEDLSSQVGVFTGGDPGEGLDLQGMFQYAVNFGAPGGFSIGAAHFTDQNAPGVTIAAENSIDNWFTPNFGSSADDLNLNRVMDSIRWSDAALPGTDQVTIELANLMAGKEYKLQLLFQEGCCGGRGFDVYVEDGLAVDNFSPAAVVGGVDFSRGAVITHQFIAQDSVLNIRLDGRGQPFSDKNAIIQGLTLETVPEPSTAILAALGAIGLLAWARGKRRSFTPQADRTAAL